MDENLHDKFMKLGDLTELDNQILADAGADNLIDRMQEEKNKQVTGRTRWMQEVKAHWFSYALLALSFLLTEMLALYLGLAPYLTTDAAGNQLINFHSDFGHIATAIVYMLVFPIVTEAAFAVAWNKFRKAETGNYAQVASSVIAIAASLISIVGTGVAGGYVILSTLGSLGFLEIPQAAKSWLVWVIPSLLALFALLHGIYDSSSRHEKSLKLVEEEEKNDELSDKLRMSKIERAGKRAMKAAAIQSYEKAISLGLLSQAEAEIGLAQGKSLLQLERDLNRDLTGEGKIGDTSGLNTPPPSKPIALPRLRIPKEYKLDELLAFLGASRAQAVDIMNQYGLTDPYKAYSALAGNGYLPEDLELPNFERLFRELMAGAQAPIISSNGNGHTTGF